MDQDSNQMESSNGPVQCRNGCGFYSNAGTEGLCSVCYKDTIKKKQQPPTNMPASLVPSSMAPSGPVSSASPSQMASLSIGESSMASAITSSVPSSSPTTNIRKAGSSSVETALPTVILPSSSSALQTEKRTESELDPLGIAAATVASSALGADSGVGDDNLATGAETPDGQNGKKKKNRCFNCKKKVGLTGFTCRCGGLFCSIHRYSDKHECNFDYKELGAEEIRKSNPVVVAKKVQKI